MMPQRDLIQTRQEKEKYLEKIYNEYKDLLFFISLQLVKDKSVAEEIINDTFLNFFNQLDKIDLKRNIKYYLTTSVRNLSLNYLKKVKLDIVVDEFLVNQQHDKDNTDWLLIYDKLSSLTSQEELNIVSYHLFFNFSFKEIAKLHNCTTNTISGKYNRALKKLKKYYKEDDIYEKK